MKLHNIIYILLLTAVFSACTKEPASLLDAPDCTYSDGEFTLVKWAGYRMILDRESYDFGRPRWHLLETLKVPAQYRGLRIVYTYDDGFHEDFNVSDELRIEYEE